MTDKEFQSVIDLAKERDRKLYDWLRHLVLLASGALTVLVALHPQSPVGCWPLLCLRLAWIALGLGILLGAFALHGEVWSAGALARQVGARLSDMPSQTGATLFVGTTLPKRYERARFCCYASLIVAVCSLVIYSVIR